MPKKSPRFILPLAGLTGVCVAHLCHVQATTMAPTIAPTDPSPKNNGNAKTKMKNVAKPCCWKNKNVAALIRTLQSGQGKTSNFGGELLPHKISVCCGNDSCEKLANFWTKCSYSPVQLCETSAPIVFATGPDQRIGQVQWSPCRDSMQNRIAEWCGDRHITSWHTVDVSVQHFIQCKWSDLVGFCASKSANKGHLETLKQCGGT